MCVLVDLFWYFIRAMPYRGLQPKSISKRRSVIKGDGGLMLFFTFVDLLRMLYKSFISYYKFIMSKALK